MLLEHQKLSPTGHYSPLRYPGGKGKLAKFIASLIRKNGLSDGLYVEPYAGGAAVAWELLLTGVVRRVAINDLSRPVHAFWSCVLTRTDELIDLIQNTPVTLENRDRLKLAFNDPATDELLLGFAMFFLNRTHRSGILNAGVIGGREQDGPWKIDARYNKADLIRRIRMIASARRRIKLTNMDAVKFLESENREWKQKTLIYLDPPYYEKGRQLYYDFYRLSDHESVAKAVTSLSNVSWVVSYDDVRPVCELYESTRYLKYSIGYSAREVMRGCEAMFFSPGLTIPVVTDSMIEVERSIKVDHAGHGSLGSHDYRPELTSER